MDYRGLLLFILFLPVSILGYIWFWVEVSWSLGREWHLSKEQKAILHKARKLPE